MPRKLLLAVASLLILTLLGGCWSRREVEELAIVTVIGLDKITVNNEDKFRIAFRVIRPALLGGGQQGGGAQGTPSWVATTFGDTPYDAFRNMMTRSPRRFFAAHAQIIVLGESLARDGVHEAIDVLIRHKEIRLRNWVMLKQGEALEVVKAEPEMETLIANEIDHIISITGPLVSKNVNTDFREFAMALLNPGMDPVVSWIQTFSPPEEGAKSSSRWQSGQVQGGQGQGQELQTIRITGAAVFRKDKLAGFLGDNQTKGYLFIRGKAQGGVIPVRFPGEEENSISFVMIRSKSKIIPEVKGEKISFRVEIECEGDLGESQETQSITTPEGLAKVEKAVQSVIKLYCQSALNKAQKDYQADIFGFGDQLHKKEPRTWKQVEKDWYDVYPEVPVTIEVKAKIRRTGMLSEPLVIK